MSKEGEKGIRTRETNRTVKTLDRAAEAAKSMKQATIRTKDTAQRLLDDGHGSASEYAEDNLRHTVERTADRAERKVRKDAGKTRRKVREYKRRRREERRQERDRQKELEEQQREWERWWEEKQRELDQFKEGWEKRNETSRETKQESGRARSETGREASQESRQAAGQKTGPADKENSGFERTGRDGKAGQTGRIRETGGAGSEGTENKSSAKKPAVRAKREAGSRVNGVRQHEARVRRLSRSERVVKRADASGKAVRKTARSAGKATPKTVNNTIKATKKTVKTAEQTAKTTIKTTKAAAKTAAKTTKKTAETARQAAALVRRAAILAYKLAVMVAKGAALVGKGIMLAFKGLIAAFAGGWAGVILASVFITLLGMLVGSAYGVFFSSEDTGSGRTMQTVVKEIDQEYQTTIETIKALNIHDSVEMSGSRAVWREVLSVYAVKVNYDAKEPQEVATIDENKSGIIREIFWEMNEIDYHTETKTVKKLVEKDDGNGNIVQEEVKEKKTVLYITVLHKSIDEMADKYGFGEEQRQIMRELLDEKNRLMWTAVLYGIRDSNTDIVEVALSQLGNEGGEKFWSWYGFDSRVSWCACFVSWCANECGYIEDGIIPMYSLCADGVEWFKSRNQWLDGSEEPVPGMIIFYDWDNHSHTGPQDGHSDHTGIVQKVEDGVVYTVEGNSGDSVRERSYEVGHYEIMGYGVPGY